MGHKEHPDGLPSVTQVLGVVDKPFLRLWYGKNGIAFCEKVKKEAGELGQHVHDAIEHHLLDRKEDLSLEPREYDITQNFIRWKQDSGFVPLELERKVESKKHGYHGTFDALGHFGDVNALVLADWKTSNQLDDLYGAQIAAYAAAYTEETGKEVDSGLVVRMAKDPDKRPQLETRVYKGLDRYFKVFLACKQIWEFTHKKGKWAK